MCCGMRAPEEPASVLTWKARPIAFVRLNVLAKNHIELCTLYIHIAIDKTFMLLPYSIKKQLNTQ